MYKVLHNKTMQKYPKHSLYKSFSRVKKYIILGVFSNFANSNSCTKINVSIQKMLDFMPTSTSAYKYADHVFSEYYLTILQF